MHPRFALVLGHRIGNRLVPPWPSTDRTLDARAAPKTWIAWRLLGGNHREVARSAEVFPDAVTSASSIHKLRSALDKGTTDIAIEPVDRMWGWTLSVDASPAAVGSRLYSRQRECEYNCGVFLASAAIADLPTALTAVALRQRLAGC